MLLNFQDVQFDRYISQYSGTGRRLSFYSKDETTDVDDDVVNTNDFKSFMCKANLFGNTVTDERSFKGTQQLL